MKQTLMLGWLGAAVSALAATAATVPSFINDAPVYAPPDSLPTINATSFVNQSIFSIGSGFVNGPGTVIGLGTSLPYETYNTLFYTNEASGIMSGSPGFRFLHTIGRTRRAASWFVNEGSVDATSYLEIKATNIVSSGPMNAGAAALIRIAGKDVNLERTGLRTGLPPGGFFGGGENFPPSTTYFNAPGVTDAYWAVGSNGLVNTVGNPTPLNSPDINFNLPNGSNTFNSPSTPRHQVLQLLARRQYTNVVDLPKFGSSFGDGFGAFAYTNILGGTSAMVQVVFVRTNAGFFLGSDSNFSASVRFAPPVPGGPAKSMVEFRISDFDLALGTYNTNFIYVTDSSALVTNFIYHRPSGQPGNTRRPNVHEVLRSTPFDWSFYGLPANSTFVNGMLTTGYRSNAVGMRYAAYSADITAAGTTTTTTPGTSGVSSPTNFPGRVEIFADKLNVGLTRIRSESTIIIKTKDLSSNSIARVDAPYLSFDLTSKQPELLISNLAPVSVNRLSGSVCVWSGIWRNYQIDPVSGATNEINFHVMFVDHALQSLVPVQTFDFFLHATNLVIADNVSVTKAIALDSRSLDVRGSLTFPYGSSWARTNVPQLLFFTNRGFISIPGAARYGTDRPAPYANIVNYGTNTAASQFIRAQSLENSGCFQSSAGPVSLDAVTASLQGPPLVVVPNIQTQFVYTNSFQLVTNLDGSPVTILVTNLFTNSIGAKLSSSGDLQIKARDLTVSNSVLSAGASGPGRLLFTITNRLVDAGPEALNYWSASSGFEMRRLPATSSLLGTWLATTVAPNQNALHTWSGRDFGAVNAGFNNNLALGKLTIDVSTNNGRATFRSVSGNQALYVDYIEFKNAALNFNSTLAVFPNLTIYFANANVPVEKLDGALNGRFRWVPSFAGPLSTTNITYPSGNSYAFNIALANSQDIDSDGGGRPNADDPYPFDVPGETVPDDFPAPVPRLLPSGLVSVPAAPSLAISLVDAGRKARAVLSWDAPASASSTLEFKNSFGESDWNVLTNFVNGPLPTSARVHDPIGGPASMRVYRLRIGPVSGR